MCSIVTYAPLVTTTNPLLKIIPSSPKSRVGRESYWVASPPSTLQVEAVAAPRVEALYKPYTAFAALAYPVTLYNVTPCVEVTSFAVITFDFLAIVLVSSASEKKKQPQ